jgi:6,7-dimethyl-8-ribityllumazine synthase
MYIDKQKIAIITSKFNTEVTQLLYEGAKVRLEEKGVVIASEDIFFVPGAVEIPVIAAQLARSKKYNAIICLGAVIRGETSHYDYVCESVTYGCQKVAIEYGIPVVFGVLTTENEEQAFARCGGSHGHKGRDAADVALEMISVMSRLPEVFVSTMNDEKHMLI